MDILNVETIGIIEYGKKCYDKGYAPGTCGNISIRKPDNSGFFIKASGTCFDELTEDDILFVDMEGNCNHSKKPSIEMPFHHNIYLQRDDVFSVIHLHPPFSIVVSSKFETFPLSTVSARKFFKSVPIIPDAEPGSRELAEQVIKCFSNTDVHAIALEGHGIVTVGKDISQAFYLADILEHDSEITYLINSMHK